MNACVCVPVEGPLPVPLSCTGSEREPLLRSPLPPTADSCHPLANSFQQLVSAMQQRAFAAHEGIKQGAAVRPQKTGNPKETFVTSRSCLCNYLHSC